jgi:ATP-dependent RNA circularization protein (DNA/RNA ligase family)
VIVEEKLDGTNIGISVAQSGELQVQARGSYIELKTLHPQFKPLRRWLNVRRERLVGVLGLTFVLFGEWCYARHTVSYNRLPDWFVAFDIFDRTAERFLSVDRRDRLAARMDLSTAPQLTTGRFDLCSVQRLLGDSRFGDGPAEGIYFRHDHEEFLVGRAKLVRAEFIQAIGEHWQRRQLTLNRIAGRSVGAPDIL